jgi:hypothetical protein
LVKVFHDWLARLTTRCPGMASIAYELKTNAILGEVKSVNCDAKVQLCLRQANAVFVNNLLFHDLQGRSAMHSVNGLIGEMLCGCEVGTWLVTTTPITARVESRELKLWSTIKWKRRCFSWADVTGPTVLPLCSTHQLRLMLRLALEGIVASSRQA